MNESDILQLIGTVAVAILAVELFRVDHYRLFRRLVERCIGGWIAFVAAMRMVALFDLLSQQDARIVNGMAAVAIVCVLMNLWYVARCANGVEEK